MHQYVSLVMVWRFVGMMKRKKDNESVTNLVMDDLNSITSDKEKEMDKTHKETDLQEKVKTKVNIGKKN